MTHSYMGMYSGPMARAATTSDVFNAVAEPRRRALLDCLVGGEQPVGELVARSGLGPTEAPSSPCGSAPSA